MGKGDRRPIRDGDEWEKGDRRPIRDGDEWEKGDRRPIRDGDEWERGTEGLLGTGTSGKGVQKSETSKQAPTRKTKAAVDRRKNSPGSVSS